MLDYEELRIWKTDLLNTEIQREESILESIWNLTSFSSMNLLFGILDLRNGLKRPRWTLEFQLTIHFLKNYLLQENHSLSRARRRLDLVKDWIPTSPEFELEHVEIFLSFQEILVFESVSSNTSKYPIPQELEDDTKSFCIKGEFLKDPKRPQQERKVVLYLHGGAYILGAPSAFRHLTSKIAKECNTDVFVLDYRLAPEFPFPAALHDVFAAYLWLLNPSNSIFSQSKERFSYKPENIYLGGDSAGGGLVMCFLNYLNHYIKFPDGRSIVPMPGAAFMFSPWSDLSMSSNSLRTNAEFDYLPRHMTDLKSHIYPGIPHPVYSYIIGQDNKRRLPVLKKDQTDVSQGDVSLYRSEIEIKSLVESYIYHPLISPVFESNFSCLPPILIQSGDCEMLRDETITLAYKISISNKGQTGAKVRHELYKDMVHVFQAITSMKSSQIAIENVANFLDHVRLKGHLDDLSCAESDFFIVNSHHRE